MAVLIINPRSDIESAKKKRNRYKYHAELLRKKYGENNPLYRDFAKCGFLPMFG